MGGGLRDAWWVKRVNDVGCSFDDYYYYSLDGCCDVASYHDDLHDVGIDEGDSNIVSLDVYI